MTKINVKIWLDFLLFYIRFSAMEWVLCWNSFWVLSINDHNIYIVHSKWSYRSIYNDNSKFNLFVNWQMDYSQSMPWTTVIIMYNLSNNYISISIIDIYTKVWPWIVQIETIVSTDICNIYVICENENEISWMKASYIFICSNIDERISYSYLNVFVINIYQSINYG